MSVAVAAPHHAALAAADEALAAGGNALDAALAAAVTLTVVYPHQCSLGGDLVALVRTSDGEVSAVLSVGAAPAGVDTKALALLERMPPQGAPAVTVPGVVAGWEAIAGFGTRLPLTRHLGRAAGLADAGVDISPGLARALVSRRDAVLSDPGLREAFSDGAGGLLGEGDLWRQPRLAETLRTLAADPWAMYAGAVAESVVACLRAHGSAMTPADFRAHRAEVAEPFTREIAGRTFWAAPPPSQGVVLLGILAEALGDDPGELVEAMRDAALVRAAELGDPRGGLIDTAAMLAPRTALRGELPRTGHQLGDTVAVVAADDDGTVVTLIQSVYQTFGAGLMEPSTGIVLHNRGSAFSTDPDHPGHVGPGLRPPHTLLPLIAGTDGLVAGLGCQGGSAQPWILAQIVGDLLEPETAPEGVLARPRAVVGARDLGFGEMTLLAEPGADAAQAAAARLGLPVSVAAGPVDEAGHVQVVRVRAGRRLDAATDPRADGTVLIR